MATLTTRHHAAAAVPRSPHRTRADLEGLRAIAILLIVAFHVGLPGAGGGFVGIDIFFVLSGFLISRSLSRDAEEHHRISLGATWSRRVQRVVPSVALMAIVTLCASALVLPVYDLDTVGRQGQAAALYVSNIFFAAEGQDLFARDITDSPFLHTWSIGVWAQFALLWPILVGAICWLRRQEFGRRTSDFRRKATAIAFGALFAASFALSMQLSADPESNAFFSLPSRLWEFAAAGLLAVAPMPRWLRRGHHQDILGTVGLLLIGGALVLIDGAGSYPAPWALLPVAGTLLLIVAGETWEGTVPASRVSGVLGTAGLRALGGTSFSWYLWHWPLIVLAVVALDEDSVVIRSAAAAIALPVAVLTYRLFESPVRFSPVLTRSRFRTFAIAIVTTVLVLAVASLVRPDGFRMAPTEGLSVTELEAPTGSSLPERVAFAQNLLEERLESSCPTDAVLSPDGDKYCVDGDVNGRRTLLLLGDSHAGQWRPVLSAIAGSNDIRLVIRQHNGCWPYQIPIAPGESGLRAELCEQQQLGNLRILERLDPDVVIVAAWAGNGRNLRDERASVLEPTDQAAAWEEGVSNLFEIIQARGSALGLIQDAPTLPFLASECLSTAQDVAACNVTRDDAFASAGPLLAAEDEVLDSLDDVAVFDTRDLMCEETTCQLEVDGTLVYVDSHHLTDAFAARQVEPLERLVAQLLS